jgi:hypothetical protein
MERRDSAAGAGSPASPLGETLPTVADDELLANRLRMPLACMVDARGTPCLHDAVNTLRESLWDAYRRGLAHWWKEGYEHHAQSKHEPIARRMIEIALDSDRELLKSLHSLRTQTPCICYSTALQRYSRTTRLLES